VVVLGDEFHHWVTGLDGMLAIVEKDLRNGLGTADCPVPLVVTGSSIIAGGSKLKAFTDKNAAMGLRAPPLEVLALPDAVLGFEWVLLHPWLKDRGPELRVVYTRAKGANRVKVEKNFELLGGIPTTVKKDLYLVAQTLVINDQFVVGDDEKAWHAYVDKYG
jgi:hypothetical protein